MIRTLIVDDDPFVRMSLQTILEAQDDVEVCALGADGDEAVELFERLVVDQILQPVFRMLQRLPLIGDAVCRDTVRIRQFAVFYGNPLQFLVFFLRPVCIVRLPSVRGFGFSRSMCACSCCLS